MIDLREIAKHSRASQDKFELWRLLEVLNARPPKVIVEVGVHKGFSIETWKKAFDPQMIVGIDNDAQFIETRGFELIVGNSNDEHTRNRLIDHLGMRQIDFLFLDGDHTYEGVSKDFELYAPLVGLSGVVAIHDTRRTGEKWIGKVETHRFFEEMRDKYPSCEFWNGVLPDTPGTGVLFL